MKSILIKIVFIIISLSYISSYLKTNKDPATTMDKVNTMYTDATIDINDYRTDDLMMFFAYLKSYQYDKAYALLDDNCKSATFKNSIDNFKKTIERTFLDENVLKKDVSYDFINESTFNETEVLYRVTFTTIDTIGDNYPYDPNKSLGFYYPKSMDVLLYETSPFNHRFFLRIALNDMYNGGV